MEKILSTENFQPLIISIENKTDKEMSNIILFGASNVFNNLFSKKENFIDGLEIKSGIANVNYSDFILKTISNKINIERMCFFSDVKLSELSLGIRTKDVNGNSFQRTFLAELVIEDELKQKEESELNQFKVEKKITIDCFTELIIDKIMPKSTITIYFY